MKGRLVIAGCEIKVTDSNRETTLGDFIRNEMAPCLERLLNEGVLNSSDGRQITDHTCLGELCDSEEPIKVTLERHKTPKIWVGNYSELGKPLYLFVAENDGLLKEKTVLMNGGGYMLDVFPTLQRLKEMVYNKKYLLNRFDLISLIGDKSHLDELKRIRSTLSTNAKPIIGLLLYDTDYPRTALPDYVLKGSLIPAALHVYNDPTTFCEIVIHSIYSDYIQNQKQNLVDRKIQNEAMLMVRKNKEFFQSLTPHMPDFLEYNIYFLDSLKRGLDFSMDNLLKVINLVPYLKQSFFPEWLNNQYGKKPEVSFQIAKKILDYGMLVHNR